MCLSCDRQQPEQFQFRAALNNRLIKMHTSVLLLCLLAAAADGRNAFKRMFPEKYPRMWKNGVDPGEPLFLTPYIEQGKEVEGVSLSMVPPLDGTQNESYAGFLTVNKTTDSNMFFWFFPVRVLLIEWHRRVPTVDPFRYSTFNIPWDISLALCQFGASTDLEKRSTAPVLLWLQGGPGGSSLFGLFVENGPYTVTKDLKILQKAITWNSKFSMLYIDNPVGTGFSFTKSDSGYARNEVDVARDLYSCLTQFFTLFKSFQTNEFYITGESYAGKYVPAISYKIHMENPTADLRINLAGMAIGDGLCDPETMMPQYADFMYSIGMLDESQRDYFQMNALKAVKFIRNKQFMEAFQIFDMLLNGDLYPYKPFFYNVTQTNNYYNFMLTEEPESFGYYGNLLADPQMRKNIHVGNLTYNDGVAVEKHLMNDVMDTVKPWVATLMDNYKVMMYSGQLDIIVATPLTEAFLLTVPWTGQQDYMKADRLVWKINPDDKEVAGYVRQVGKFYQVVVRSAGHILPYDQPARGMDMITRFVENRSFA